MGSSFDPLCVATFGLWSNATADGSVPLQDVQPDITEHNASKQNDIAFDLGGMGSSFDPLCVATFGLWCAASVTLQDVQPDITDCNASEQNDITFNLGGMGSPFNPLCVATFGLLSDASVTLQDVQPDITDCNASEQNDITFNLGGMGSSFDPCVSQPLICGLMQLPTAVWHFKMCNLISQIAMPPSRIILPLISAVWDLLLIP